MLSNQIRSYSKTPKAIGFEIMSSGYYLKLENFEGPLDLLLYLIKVNELDIFNIDVVIITNQYLNHLRVMEFSDLAQAGEFLEMASTLLEIKTRMLLPSQGVASENSDGDPSDPLRDLQKRLLDYETFRNASKYFEGAPQIGVEIQTSNEWNRLAQKYETIESPLRGDVASVVILYEQLLRDFIDRKPDAVVEAVTHRIGIQEAIVRLKDLLTSVKFVMLQSFYRDFQSRYELIVNIISILEMSRWGQAKIYQEEMTDPIWVYRPDVSEDILPANRRLMPSSESISVH